MSLISRREILNTALALAASNALPLTAQPRLAGMPFTLGVASGEPTPDGAVLWTRLAPTAPPPNVNISVNWEIAEDEQFKKLAKKGQAVATPALAHSVHVEAAGLKPARWYWYRFTADGHQSPKGRFKTAPAPGQKLDKLNFAFASCQQWTQGYWTAYQHLAQEPELDLVIHLGDYIYEQGYKGAVRPEGQAETFTLADYRNRHTLYKSDPLLQAAHARAPWIVTWDDHEVSNNYASDIHERDQPREEFLKRRAWAYQAYYENMPLRRESVPTGPDLRLHRRLDFGSLLRLHMLDTRQFRSDQACGDRIKSPCGPEWSSNNRTLLGAGQEEWLETGIRGSQAVWDVLGQQILVTLQDFDPSPDQELYNMDSWSGYPVARDKLVNLLASRKDKRNTVILTGDVHASWVGQLHQEARNINSPCVATEFVGTSISSGGDGADTAERTDRMLPSNPQIRYFNGRRGYVRCEVTPKSWRTDYRLLDYVTKPGAPIQTKASFTIEPGKLTVDRA